jgi:hypothetical protein
VCSIGSAPATTCRSPDETVSGFHCEIRLAPDRVHLVDLGSLNGTVVDGVHVKERSCARQPDPLGAAKVRFELATATTACSSPIARRSASCTGSPCPRARRSR